MPSGKMLPLAKLVQCQSNSCAYHWTGPPCFFLLLIDGGEFMRVETTLISSVPPCSLVQVAVFTDANSNSVCLLARSSGEFFSYGHRHHEHGIFPTMGWLDNCFMVLIDSRGIT